ncbi:MAG TPA: STAS domain-containing protein [Caldimonas sp.]|jgi:ABC-type transporter Mla MlaB component|nr:STAS domain-containing protein [Caldimonas sp.]HEX2542340.1 STAS domain-containing protein [Caldimonas sp.]
MAEQKDTTSFFRKVVKFVANPATEWAELDAPVEDTRESDYAKGELKAMIERKRRNDFVRKREFDMLRKVRREGLTGEQLAALGGSSRIDDSQPRISDQPVRQDAGVKAKIDEIEQQMVGENYATTQRRTPEFYNAPTQPAVIEGNGRAAGAAAVATPPAAASPRGGGTIDFVLPAPVAPQAPAAAARPAASKPASLAPIHLDMPGAEAFGKAFASANAEVAHDPDLDEAVIAFANADFEQCEESLSALTRPGGSRCQHAETWLVVFDLYRAIGQQQKFESLALDYAQQFGWSAPQWFSLPKLVAEAASEDRPSSAGADAQVGWACPSYLDADGVAKLASLSLQMPLPWVFDWGALQTLDAEASGRLSELFRTWIPQDLDMRWLSGERLFTVIQEAAPNGVRDADPAFWQLRLDALRMANRADQFDEAAIDYCVTYEVSPPSWEPARCVVRITGSKTGTTQPPLSMISDVSTSFQESQVTEDAAMVEVGTVELSGQLVGDIGATLRKMDAQLASSKIVNVSCARLIRVDFIAAGDLLNWVLARRAENRVVRFIEAHRMVALFFGAMGINEHATVKVRTV